MIETEGYIVDVCTDRAISFIRNHKQDPFFCYIPFTTPHSPWAAPPELWEKFKDLEITRKGTAGNRQNIDQTRCAYAMMENQDYNVGRVLKELETLNLQNDTIVLYFSDNGPNGNRWNGGLKGIKASTEEGGVRSVCYIRFPGKIPPGRSIPTLAAAIDLLPTLTALAGIKPPDAKPLDGINLRPLLVSNDPTPPDWPERFIFSSWPRNVSVRSQTQRLAANGKLFDIAADPDQSNALNDELPEIAAKMTAAGNNWKAEVFQTSGKQPDTRPLPVGYPEFPVTMLPARDAKASGGIKRSAPAPNSSYFTNWTSEKGTITWQIDVHTAGTYIATADYTCPPSDAGSEIQLAFADAKLVATVTPGWDPPLLTNQDTIPRDPAESPMKKFKNLELGKIELPSGPGKLTLSALKIPATRVMDLRRITLTLLPAAE